jgi:hypothetical protein
MNDASTFLFVRNWQPHLFQTAGQIERELHAELEALVGRTLDAVWVVWDHAHDEWFSDAPVVFEFGDRRLEVAVNKVDELYLSCDAIDFEQDLGWPDDDLFDLRWLRNPPFIPASHLGRRVSRFGASEYAFQLSEYVGTLPWVLVSFECELDGEDVIAVTNGLDENDFRFSPPDEREDLRVIWF